MAFQNPAQNYSERRLNLGDLVSLSPLSTYLARSDSDYPSVGILKGSVLVIDRGLTPKNNSIIIANVENELVLRRLLTEPKPALQELGADMRISLLATDEELPVWGVVAYTLTDMAGLGFNPL